MKTFEERSIVIVGGGPVGLFLAVSLARHGIDVLVAEKRTETSPHSRAIGIHPPALKAFAEVGLADDLICSGVRIRRARGFFGTRPLGRMDFEAVLPPPYAFALAVPQTVTESLIERRLIALSPEALQRGVEYVSHRQETHHVLVTLRTPTGETTVRTRLLIGCDGGNSRVRADAGIETIDRAYPDRYRMGDFADTTAFGDEAVLFLAREGIIESFPLPHGRRRWVAHTDSEDLVGEIERRTGIRVCTETCSMRSSFRVGERRARRLFRGRVFLAGDAAHVCSPMGGQGMNCGILGAERLAALLTAAISGQRTVEEAGKAYEAGQLPIARTVSARAFFNTAMGRGGATTGLRAAGMAGLLRFRPTHDYLARLFTMQGL